MFIKLESTITSIECCRSKSLILPLQILEVISQCFDREKKFTSKYTYLKSILTSFAKFIHWNYPQIREYLKHLKNQNCLKTSQIKATFSFANGTNINTPTILTRQNKPRRKPGLLSYQMTLATHKNMRKMSLSCKTPSDETF